MNNIQFFATSVRYAVTLGTLLVFYGWLSHNAVYVQLVPDFSPTQFNAGLCFLFSVIALSFNGPTVIQQASQQTATVCLIVLSGLTLMQDILQLSLGIDTLFLDNPFLVDKTPNPGRMSPLTAICFLFIGMICIIRGRPNLKTELGMRVYLGALFALTLVAGSVLLGYLLSISDVQLGASYTEQAIVSALLFLGLAFINLVNLLHEPEFPMVERYFNANSAFIMVFLWSCYLSIAV
ncbi:hypothetical protein ACFSJY_05495 [Thalassotalea euphylliae]|uniref:hypothetical protein n=1 Tax=Thalassotalea euphylliae TaxID=1655234 RepID=UPI003636CB27